VKKGTPRGRASSEGGRPLWWPAVLFREWPVGPRSGRGWESEEEEGGEPQAQRAASEAARSPACSFPHTVAIALTSGVAAVEPPAAPAKPAGPAPPTAECIANAESESESEQGVEVEFVQGAEVEEEGSWAGEREEGKKRAAAPQAGALPAALGGGQAGGRVLPHHTQGASAPPTRGARPFATTYSPARRTTGSPRPRTTTGGGGEGGGYRPDAVGSRSRGFGARGDWDLPECAAANRDGGADADVCSVLHLDKALRASFRVRRRVGGAPLERAHILARYGLLSADDLRWWGARARACRASPPAGAAGELEGWPDPWADSDSEEELMP
jgi:hypothetical protein